MNNFQKIINSFSLQESLNPKIWKNPKKPQESIMVPKVRMALSKIAEEFIDYLGEDVFVDDVVLTGSLANFNWSEFSDFDLHVVIDFQQYEKDAELFKQIYDLKKFIFNEKHNIKIFGYDVELYAQDKEESHFASGMFSIMNNEWLIVPQKMDFEIDREVLENKIKCWTNKIEKTIESVSTDDDKKLLKKVKEKLKDYRKSGLKQEGELSYENLVFKFLRRSGHIEKLFKMEDKLLDKELSVENKSDL